MLETKRNRLIKIMSIAALSVTCALDANRASAQLNWNPFKSKTPEKTEAPKNPNPQQRSVSQTQRVQQPQREPTLAPPRNTVGLQPAQQNPTPLTPDMQSIDTGASPDAAALSANTNPSMVLLKDASEKAKTAKTDADLSEVIALAQEALKEKPTNETKSYAEKLLSWSLNRRGQMFSANQLHEPAIEDFTAALQYDPTLWRAVHNRGVSYASLGKANEAIADFNKSLEMNRNFANTWFNRAELLLENKMYDKAYADFTQVLRLSPNDAGALAGRGKAAIKLGKIREAAADLDQAVKLEPRDASLRVARADLYLFGRNFAVATSDYQEAIKINPQSGPAHRGLAWIMSTCPDEKYRNAESALQMAQKAMELDGDADPRSVETLAAAYANGGQFDAASELLKHAGDKATGEVAARMQLQIAAYKESKPWRDGEVAGVVNAKNAAAAQIQQRQPAQQRYQQPVPQQQQQSRQNYSKQATRPNTPAKR